jgi:hypothetical protein
MEMPMYCPNCGSAVPDGAKFCLECGRRIAAAQIASDSKHIWQGISLLAIAGLVVLILLFVNDVSKRQSTAPRSPTSGASTAASGASSGSYVPIPQKQVLVNNQSFIVSARRINMSRIQVTRVCQVVGHFQAQGGSGNDVRVVITNEDGYQNLLNNHAFSYWYDSGKATAGTINVTLGADKYYVVFDNRFSMISNKAVTLYLEETCN